MRRSRRRARSASSPPTATQRAALEPALCFVDLASEWRAGRLPLRQLLRRRADRLRALPSRERRQVEELLFAYARWRDRVDTLVEWALQELPVDWPRPTPRQRLRLACSLVGRLAQLPTAALDPVETAAIAHALQREGTASDPIAALVQRHGFERAIVEEWHAALGPGEIEGALAAFDRRPLFHLRPRWPATAATVIAELAADGIAAEPHPVVPQAVVVTRPIRLDRHPLLTERRASVQDAASQLALQALAVEPGQTVVDCCAGGGGKAEAIADLLRGRGRLALFDRDRRRLAAARARLAAAAGPGLRLSAEVRDGRIPPPPDERGRADRVLVDAPCSGLGTAHRQPDLKWRYRDRDIARFTADQVQLATQAALLLAPGGRLLYATCSLRRAENDDVADALLRRTGLSPLPLHAVLGALADRLGANGERLTLWPHRHRCDGFFLALFERR
ncbi:MAG: RsmB/NOP family class I SAM-dependent RNA methyltransferase [Deltaproteobacteria bacterium]|nr:RsmB/NOP family class I SAM-dependent RNA methyltransferase [Deltaproteobacteria bacterium]